MAHRQVPGQAELFPAPGLQSLDMVKVPLKTTKQPLKCPISNFGLLNGKNGAPKGTKQSSPAKKPQHGVVDSQLDTTLVHQVDLLGCQLCEKKDLSIKDVFLSCFVYERQ